jgi:hypothetical protein
MYAVSIWRRGLVAGAGLLLAGGAYMGMTSLQHTHQQAPMQVAEAFTTAVIRNDVNGMGVLLGVDPKQGSPMEQTFGKVLGGLLEDYADDQAQNPKDYRWEIREQQVKAGVARLQIDLYVPNYAAQAEKVSELLGYTTDAEGTLVGPEELAMDVTEARRLANEDPAIKPLHYRVPLRLIQQNGKWVVDARGKTNDALVSVIRRSDTLTDNEEYLVK